MSDPKSEAELIQHHFAPLALGAQGAYGLRDDVAMLPASAQGLIVTQDQIIENTHFLPEDPLDMAARRLVRRNLSDMIAKGGIPTAAFLSLAWPKSRDRSSIADFAAGLGDDLDRLCGKCPLMGGDTSETNGPLVASLTLMGRPTAENGQPVLRSGARVGDIVAVTGVIGDSWLGLKAREGLLSKWRLKACAQFSLAPSPPDMGIAALIGRYATASIDVSDGLIIDASHIAKASGLAITLDLAKMPISDEAENFDDFQCDIERSTVLAIGGDDYQPLVTLSALDFKLYKKAAARLGVKVAAIGTCVVGEGVSLLYNRAPIDMPSAIGWQM